MTKDTRMNLIPYLRECRKSLIFFLCFLSSVLLSAQNVSETRWYFGNSAENLVFDRNGLEVFEQTDQAVPFGSGGSVTITDQFTGNLLFYTDGTQVYDISHSLTPTGSGLSGNAAINVPVVTCPVTGSPGQYYLFTNSGSTGVNEIQTSIVDATMIGNGTAQFPYGDVTSVNQPTGLVNPSEGMLIIPSGDGEVFWLISQNRNSFEINVTQIDEGGIGVTRNYQFENDTIPGFEASHFSYNLDSSKIAVAPKASNRNIWLLNFDRNSGALTFDHSLLNTGFDDHLLEAVYDIEWSRDGSKLYFSRFGGGTTVGQLYQIDFNDSTETVNAVLTNSIFRSLGLKRAIDNRIYHLYQETNTSPFSIGRINLPDSVSDSVNYQQLVFDANFNGRQFSEHTAGYNFTFDTLGFYWIDSCLTNTTKFFPTVEPIPQNLFWILEPGLFSNAWIPTYEYQNEGTYSVTLVAEINGITQSVTEMVEILSNDLMVDLGVDTTICVDEILVLDAGTAASYVWNTGDTTQTINVDTLGTYWVEVTNATGCTGFDDIEVTEYGVVAQTSNQWYFGEQAGIEFTNGPLAILDGNQQMAAEGCATISDTNGDLLFYTNGNLVWNKEHEVMLNGEMIGGDVSSSQNSMILPFNGDQTMFYLFTTEQVYGDNEYALKYSIIDMKEDNGLGKVIVKDVRLMDNGTERVTATGFTGSDFLVTHEFGNNTFRSYRTGVNGLSGAIFSPVGETHAFMEELNATGYMKISPTQSQVAVNLPGTSQIEIFDIDQGQVSNPRLIDTGETDLYGMEFSSTGNKLYVTTSSASSKLIQYDLDSLNSMNPGADIEATKYDGFQQGAGYGALQNGPNGVMYMAVDNSGTIGTIASSDGDDDNAQFNPSGFDLLGRTSRLGLPNFAQNQSTPTTVPSITVTAGCAGQSSQFAATGRDPNNLIETYTWIFGDGQSVQIQDTTHIYDLPGTYTVELRLSNRCDADTSLFQTIVINNIPENPTVPTDTTLCDDPIVLTAWPTDNADFSYYWSTGDNTRQVSVSDPAIIDVAIINVTTGCSSDTVRVFIGDARPSVDIGGDIVLCQNDPSVTLDSQIPNAVSYAWAIDGVVLGNNRTFDVDSTTAGIFEYTIEIQNSFGCFGRDTIQVDIRSEPDFTAVGNPTSGCGLDNGSIDITFNTTGSYTYEISGPSSFGPFNFDGPGTESTPNTASPGNYNLTVTNIITGCSTVELVQVEDPASFNFTVSSTGNCDGDVELTLASLPTDFNYSIQTQDGSTIPEGSNQSVFPNLNTGTYFVEITDNTAPNCVETEEITINPFAEPDFVFDAIQEICGTTGNVFVTDNTGGAATYTWSGPGILSGNVNDTIQVDQPGIYTVTADQGAGFCPSTEQIEVIFNGDPSVVVEVSGDPCEGQVTLIPTITNGSGTYLFNWNDGSQAGQNTVNTSGTYTVTITDQFSSCEATSIPVEVAIQPEFEVSLSLSPDCENNGNVTIVATTNYYNPGITYQWSDGDGNAFADEDSIIVINQSGSYFVTATNESGSCMAMDNITAAVVPINEEELTLPSRVTFCTANTTDPAADLDAGIWNSYEWRLLSDPSVILSTDQVYSTTTAGSYEVTIYNGFTCVKDIVEVVEDCRPVIFAPNAFSPNGNGQNDEFFVFPNDYVDEFEILIYTRWGELVFRSTNQDFRWNGFYRGALLPVGTYAYILKFSSNLAPDLGTIEQYGSVTLIR
ncbi:MAG: PKD domain-containing protein [Ekhidna sp.]